MKALRILAVALICVELVVLLGCRSNSTPSGVGATSFSDIEGKWKVVTIKTTGDDPQEEQGKEVFEIKQDADGWKAYTHKGDHTYHVGLKLEGSMLSLIKNGKETAKFRVTLSTDKKTMTWSHDNFVVTLERYNGPDGLHKDTTELPTTK
jgi:hypothetical protein